MQIATNYCEQCNCNQTWYILAAIVRSHSENVYYFRLCKFDYLNFFGYGNFRDTETSDLYRQCYLWRDSFYIFSIPIRTSWNSCSYLRWKTATIYSYLLYRTYFSETPMFVFNPTINNLAFWLVIYTTYGRDVVYNQLPTIWISEG